MSTTTRTLVVLRHAKAEPADGTVDELRPLALAGRQQASAVGRHLRDTSLIPELVLVSSALRTRQTWELARGALRDVDLEVDVRDELYAASSTTLLDAVRRVDARVRTVLVVGHEPAVSGLAAHLAGPGSDEGALAQVRVGVPTASMSVLVGDEPWGEWDRATARLTGVFRPRA